ncbi:inositol monophosphatase family protein [Acidomonas methanolica]|uniref:inositol monophosphatase family protein n=1 Tax=Acidomonas methanolica TaxID=437 RepID=UPI00211A0E0C|nr:inositol monophosphatase family protein [Acidomonas methanolica]
MAEVMRARVTRAELARLVAIAREAARVEILPRFRSLAPDEVQSKSGPYDLVTIADERAERLVTARLLEMWPEALVIGEEAAARRPELRLEVASAALAVTVDPIDGTANYVAGVPLFGVMMAVLSYGEVLASVILDPMTMEAGVALRGEGAWIDRDGVELRRLRMAAAAPLQRMTGKAVWRHLPSRDPAQADRTFRSVAAMWDFRCAAHEYLLTADGRAHFLLYTLSLPWDHLPGWLLLHEAGAYGARFDGRPYDPRDARGGLMYASDRASWEMFAEALVIGPECNDLASKSIEAHVR